MTMGSWNPASPYHAWKEQGLMTFGFGVSRLRAQGHASDSYTLCYSRGRSREFRNALEVCFLERMPVLWILGLSVNYISIPSSMLFGNMYCKFNLLNSQVYFLPVQFNTVQICQQVICQFPARLLKAKCESSVAKWLFLTLNKFPTSYLAIMHVHNWS